MTVSAEGRVENQKLNLSFWFSTRFTGKTFDSLVVVTFTVGVLKESVGASFVTDVVLGALVVKPVDSWI